MRNSKPNIALFPAHPAQLWLMHTLAKTIDSEVKVHWILRDKDVLTLLADKLGIDYQVISRARAGLIGNSFELLGNIFKAIRITRSAHIDLWLTKYGAANIAATLCGKKSISFNDDDIDVVPLIALTSYPFAHKVIAPEWVRLGRFDKKSIRYKGSHELVYLHPVRFSPNSELIGELAEREFIIVRLSALAAHHDLGIKGVSFSFLDKLIDRFSSSYRIVISSERSLPEQYEKFRYSAQIDHMHHVLYFSRCLVTDSLSMALEAAVLATPSVRLSDFGNQISAFKAIENYHLIYNFSPHETQAALNQISGILQEDSPQEFKDKSARLVKEMEDPLPVFRSAILDSVRTMPKSTP
jgi:predicted glycosyltransferase